MLFASKDVESLNYVLGYNKIYYSSDIDRANGTNMLML